MAQCEANNAEHKRCGMAATTTNASGAQVCRWHTGAEKPSGPARPTAGTGSVKAISTEWEENWIKEHTAEELTALVEGYMIRWQCLGWKVSRSGVNGPIHVNKNGIYRPYRLAEFMRVSKAVRAAPEGSVLVPEATDAPVHHAIDDIANLIPPKGAESVKFHQILASDGVRHYNVKVVRWDGGEITFECECEAAGWGNTNCRHVRDARDREGVATK